MKKFIKHKGIAAALRIENIDTDVIIPMDQLLSVPRAELGRHAFQSLRYTLNGIEQPGFILNKPAFRRATILIAGRNFGSGSSREGAVYALDSFGIRAIIAPSYGDIFLNNCIKNGLLPIILPENQVLDLIDLADRLSGQHEIEINLTSQKILLPDGSQISFEIDPANRQRLLAGEDEISLTLRHKNSIATFQTQDKQIRPWAWNTVIDLVP